MNRNEPQNRDLKYDEFFEKNWYKSLREKLEELESTNVINKELVGRIFYAVTKKELNFEEINQEHI